MEIKKLPILTLSLVLLMLSFSTIGFAITDKDASAMTLNPYYHFPCYYDFGGFHCNFVVKAEYYLYGSHHVRYGLTGEQFGNPDTIKVDNMRLDIDRESLIVDLTTDQAGELTLVLPKTMIQAVTNETRIVVDELTHVGYGVVPAENETDFQVLVSGRIGNFSEFTTQDFLTCCDEDGKDYHPTELFDVDDTWRYRFLKIPFENDTQTIEVIGTWTSGDPRDEGLVLCADVQCPYGLLVGNQTYFVKYKFGEPDFNSGHISLNNITFTPERQSLLVNFTVGSGVGQFGVLDITIPSTLLKPLPNGGYTIIIDGKPDEKIHLASTVGFAKEWYTLGDGIYFDTEGGVRQIEIVGTAVVPEFGLSSMLMVFGVAGIVGFLIFTMRFKSWRGHYGVQSY